MFKKIFGSKADGGNSGSGSSSGGGGGGPPKSASDTIGAIQKLDDTLELLNKRSALLNKKMTDELNKAKDFTKTGNKKAALLALKNKKLIEGQLDQVENSILRITEQKMMLENQRAAMEAVNALKVGADAQKQAMKDMKIEKIDKIFEEINEQNDNMREIQEALGQSIGPIAGMDEDELLAELEEMEAAQLDTELMEPAVPAKRVDAGLPAVPTGKVKPAPAKTPEELELEQLQAEMAL